MKNFNSVRFIAIAFVLAIVVLLTNSAVAQTLSPVGGLPTHVDAVFQGTGVICPVTGNTVMRVPIAFGQFGTTLNATPDDLSCTPTAVSYLSKNSLWIDNNLAVAAPAGIVRTKVVRTIPTPSAAMYGGTGRTFVVETAGNASSFVEYTNSTAQNVYTGGLITQACASSDGSVYFTESLGSKSAIWGIYPDEAQPHAVGLVASGNPSLGCADKSAIFTGIVTYPNYPNFKGYGSGAVVNSSGATTPTGILFMGMESGPQTVFKQAVVAGGKIYALFSNPGSVSETGFTTSAVGPFVFAASNSAGAQIFSAGNVVFLWKDGQLLLSQ